MNVAYKKISRKYVFQITCWVLQFLYLSIHNLRTNNWIILHVITSLSSMLPWRIFYEKSIYEEKVDYKKLQDIKPVVGSINYSENIIPQSFRIDFTQLVIVG